MINEALTTNKTGKTEKVIVPFKTLEMVDSLLVNLANEGRNYEKTRLRVQEAMNAPKRYVIDSRGDNAFGDVRKELGRLGYKSFNSESHISRVGYNAIGVIFGCWISWNVEAFEELGFTVIDSSTFLENPELYIPKFKH